jgi:hypothetical protein
MLIMMHIFNNPKTKNAILSADEHFRNKYVRASAPNGRTMISKVSET